MNVTLRHLKIEDGNQILAIHNSESVLKYHAMKEYIRDDMLNDIKKYRLTYCLQLNSTKQIIGAIFIVTDWLRHQIKVVCLSYY